MRSFVIPFVLIVCAAAILLPRPVFAQQDHIRCGTMEHLEKQKKADPTLEARMQKQEEQLQQTVAEMKRAKGLTLEKGKPAPKPPPTFEPITIPVVVHIIYDPNVPAQNIDPTLVASQLFITNRDYAGDNPHSMGSFPDALQADTDIQFCLARQAPDGTATTGIEYRQTTVTSFPADNSMKFYSSGGLDAWDPTRYFNIWVCNLQNYAGYAQFPTGGLTATFGVVVHYSCFGYINENTLYRGGGATTTHEIGHCLNLRHIWGDDGTSCNGTDYCDDTPNQAGYTLDFNIFSGEVTDACSPTSPGINYQNFMDYSRDLAMANFTPDQVLRMQACFAARGPLEVLRYSDACNPCPIPTGLAVTSVTQTTATLAWDAMSSNSGGYNIQYRKVGTSSWLAATSLTNSLVIGGLTKKTNYEFQVENICEMGLSGFSASSTFKTAVNGAVKSIGMDATGVPALLAVSPSAASAIAGSVTSR